MAVRHCFCLFSALGVQSGEKNKRDGRSNSANSRFRMSFLFFNNRKKFVESNLAIIFDVVISKNYLQSTINRATFSNVRETRRERHTFISAKTNKCLC